MHRWRIGSANDVVLTIRAEWDRGHVDQWHPDVRNRRPRSGDVLGSRPGARSRVRRVLIKQVTWGVEVTLKPASGGEGEI